VPEDHVRPTSARWKKPLFALATTGLAVAALEGGSRVLLGRVEYPPDPLIAEGNEIWDQSREYDPLLFWRLRPGSRVQGDTVNALGLRGQEIPPKASGEFRVLSLGESTTFGFKIPYERSYNALLESRLGRQGPYRVINAGVPGYTVFQGRWLLEHRGLDLSPDAVLLYFGFNDFLPVAFREQRDPLARAGSRGLTDRQLFELRRRWPTRVQGWLFRQSNLLRWVGSRHHATSQDRGGDLVESADLVRVPEDDRWGALTEIAGLCRRGGIDLVVIVPWYGGFEDHAPLLRRLAAEFDLPLVDLPAAFRHLPESEAHELLADRTHPNAEGHALIAEEVWRVVGPRWSRALSSEHAPAATRR
jgi:lysophospholipase L1-like esterase